MAEVGENAGIGEDRQGEFATALDVARRIQSGLRRASAQTEGAEVEQSLFTPEQIIDVLKEHRTGASVADLPRPAARVWPNSLHDSNLLDRAYEQAHTSALLQDEARCYNSALKQWGLPADAGAAVHLRQLAGAFIRIECNMLYLDRLGVREAAVVRPPPTAS